MLEFLLPPGLIDGEPLDWYAVVRPTEFRGTAYDGKPFSAASGAEARILILESLDEGTAFVSRYAADFGYITDTSYGSREEAIADCSSEFGDQLGTWTPIPDGVDHAETYVLSHLAKAGH